MAIIANIDDRLKTLVDEVSGTLSYMGKADPGSATSAAVWQIRRIDTSSGLTVDWADGNTRFDNVWDDRAGLSYS